MNLFSDEPVPACGLTKGLDVSKLQGQQGRVVYLP
jgi:hypothetical protein